MQPVHLVRELSEKETDVSYRTMAVNAPGITKYNLHLAKTKSGMEKTWEEKVA